MKRFLICSGVRGRDKSLEWLRELVEARRPDGILFAGGVFDGPRQHAPHLGGARMTHNDLLFLKRFFKAMGETGVFSAIIPGTGDLPLQDFLTAGMHAEIEFPGLHLVHATIVTHDNLAVGGVGGQIVAGNPPWPETCSRTLAEYYLRGLWNAERPCKILLLAAAPPGTLGGYQGSTTSNFFIDSYHPSICVVGGDSDRRGIERVAHTLVINPGSLAEGHAVWLDLSRNVREQVELIDVHRERQLEEMEIGAMD